MHLRTHVRAEHRGRYKHGDSEYIDGMIEHDETVGTLLKALDDMGIAEQHHRRLLQRQRPAHEYLARRRDDALPLREEHQLGRRLSRAVPGPLAGRDQTGHGDQRAHEPQRLDSHALLDRGRARHRRQVRQAATPPTESPTRSTSTGTTSRRSCAPSSGTVGNERGVKSARDKFFYSDDDGMLVAMRLGDYKYSFAEQRSPGTMQVWAEPFTKLRLQKIYNLFQDPFERADITSNTFWDWQLNHIGSVYGAMDEVFKFAATFKEFPPRSIPPSFNPATIMEETLNDIRDAKKRAMESAQPKR